MNTYTSSPASNAHLTDKQINSYINYLGILPEYETDQVENHINICAECKEKFNVLFDKILDESVNKHSISLFNNSVKNGEGEHAIFDDISNNFRLTISKKNDDKFYLVFNLIPQSVHNNMIRIIVHELNLTFRFLNVDVSKEYNLPLPPETTIDSLSEISVDILISTTNEFPAKVKRSKNFVYLIAGLIILVGTVFIISLFYLIKENESGDEVVLTQHTRKEMIESANDKNPETPNEMNGIDENANSERNNDSTATADTVIKLKPEDIKIENEFSNNYALDRNINMVDTTGKNIVIISPANNDTVSNSIRFNWRDTEKNNAYKINIVNNKNNLIYETSIRGNDLNYSGRLKPGLYYWKVFVNDKIKQSGKFYKR